jgi:U3 small nucleolar RNA-associated protein 15
MTLRGHGDRVTCVRVASFRNDDRHRLLPESVAGEGKVRGKKRSSAYDNEDDERGLVGPYGQLVISASYDHTVRVWDVDATNEKGGDRCVSVMDHGDPVQCLLILPPVVLGGGDDPPTRLDDLPLLVSAGGTTLKVWNMFNGSCLGTFATRHAKTITAMCLLDVPRDDADNDDDDDDDDGSKSRRKRHIVTAGLDGLIRIHSASNRDILSGSLPYIHGMQTPEPISSLAISSDAKRIAIGTTKGVVTVHQRRGRSNARPGGEGGGENAAGARKEPRRGTYSYFSRGAHEKSHDPDDYLLTHQKKQRLAEYDALLRKFQYGDALDAVLAKRQPQAVRFVR